MLRSLAARSAASLQLRALSSTAARQNVNKQIDELIAPREVIEKKRKEMEAKYADKLKRKVEAWVGKVSSNSREGLSNLDALKEKVVAPSILAKRKAKQYQKEEAERAEKARVAAEEAAKDAEKAKVEAREEKKAAARQEGGDRTGVKVG